MGLYLYLSAWVVYGFAYAAIEFAKWRCFIEPDEKPEDLLLLDYKPYDYSGLDIEEIGIKKLD